MRRNRWIILGLVFLLVLIRITLPFVIQWKTNKVLSELPDYKGHVGGVQLALWRGTFVFNKFEMEHAAGDLSLTIQQLAFQIQWLPLLKRVVVADIDVKSPRLRILVAEPAKAPKKAAEKAKGVNKDVVQKTGKSLPDLLAGLIPFQVQTFRLQDGTVRIQDKNLPLKDLKEKDKEAPKNSQEGREKERSREARISNLEIVVQNVTNSAHLSGTPYSEGQVSARVMDNGQLKMGLKLDPTAKQPAFDLNVELTRLDLAELNPLFRWQWGVDVHKGSFAMFSEAAAKNGVFKGYVKPFLEDLEMHDAAQDAQKSVGARMKEAVVDVAAAVLKNTKSKKVATRVTFEGRFENPHVGVWEAVLTVLRNAFVKALSPNLDKTIHG